MAQFGSERDMALFKSINKELIHRYIDTTVLIYKLNLADTTTNIYDEADKKTYYTPILIPSIITIDDQVWSTEDFGADVTQPGTFGFLRDDLVENDILPEIGDVLEYRSRFFEIDGLVNNQLIVGKDPDNWFGDESVNGQYGMNLSIMFQAHMTRQSKLNIVKNRFGNSISTKNTKLPNNS